MKHIWIAERDRDKMLSLTDMWKAAGGDPNKRPVDWIRKEGAQFIEFVRENLKVTQGHDEVFQIVRGGRTPGTCAHWQIRLAYAKYLSPEFHACHNGATQHDR